MLKNIDTETSMFQWDI